VIALYKRVRDRMHRAAAIVHGRLGGSPEAYEKIDPETGQGAFVVFSNQMGEHRFVTRGAVADSVWTSPGGTVDRLPDGRARVTAHFEQAGAVLVFFGAG
jgi:hypothetical protein